MDWTDERCDQLKRMYSEGLSATEIAVELGGVTRNAVCGKIDRLKLPKRHNPPSSRPPKPKPVKRNVTRLQHYGHNAFRFVDSTEIDQVSHDSIPPEQIPIAQRKQLQELGFLDCRWPYGDPGKVDFFFCGGQRFHSSAYCAAHARISYAKAPRALSAEEQAVRRAAARRRANEGQRWGSAGA